MVNKFSSYSVTIHPTNHHLATQTTSGHASNDPFFADAGLDLVRVCFDI
jgi:hypothetical protein